MKPGKRAYHHGNLAESLLNAVDELATQFGLEAVTLRGCAKRVGVAPSAAFRHYADKRSLMTAFATRALKRLSQTLEEARLQAVEQDTDAFVAVGTAYVRFAVQYPAYFRAMWREEAIYSHDEEYLSAAEQLSEHLNSGFANTLKDQDPMSLSHQELLAWSSVHGLANLYVDGPVGRTMSVTEKLENTVAVIKTLRDALDTR